MNGLSNLRLPGRIAIWRSRVFRFSAPMQRGTSHIDVTDVGSGTHYRMYEARLRIHTDVRLHPKVPLLALAGPMHLRVAFAFSVLGGAGCGDQRGVHRRAGAQQQAFGLQDVVDHAQLSTARSRASSR